jgi:three-Cys-motif partner protein
LVKPAATEWSSEPRTLLKHQIYKRYIDCWMAKILQVFPTASVVDAFAGPGRYSDGPSGSPVVIARSFLEHSGRQRFQTMRLICNEARADRRDVLSERMQELPVDPRLEVSVLPPSRFADAHASIASMTATGSKPGPTLWVLDPFDVNGFAVRLGGALLAAPEG